MNILAFSHLVFITFSTVILVGCGGSSDSDSGGSTSQPTYTVSATAENGGAISPSNRTVVKGQTTTFSVTVNEGFQISQISGCNGSLSGSTYTTGAITSACTVTATFEELIHKVTTNVNMGGEWTPENANVEHGTTAKFSLEWIPAEYRILSVTGCEGSFNAPLYETGSITSACHIEAVFEENQAPIANAGPNQEFPSGSEVELEGTATDEDGEILTWAWEQVSGTSVTLVDATAPVLRFTAPEVSESISLTFQLSVGDNNGAVHSDQVTLTINPVFPELTGMELVLSDIPDQHSEVKAHLLTDESLGDVVWQVLTNDVDEINFTPLNDNTGIRFNADIVGSYQIVATSHSGETQKELVFNVTSDIPVDETQLADFDGSIPVQEYIGVVLNQVWVSSWNLSRNDLETLLASYNALTIVDYSEVDGVLIEFNPNDVSALEAIEELKLEAGVTSVNQRAYVGAEAEVVFNELPDDGQPWSGISGNWHLQSGEGADFVGAWTHTAGNSDVHIAILDDGYYVNHEELVDAYETRYTSSTQPHGTAVSAALIGNTNNLVGNSAANWESPALLARANLANYWSLLNEANEENGFNLRVINNSWGPMGSLTSSSIAFAHTRTYRNVALNFNNIIHVWAAGNDGGSAANKNGALHLNNQGSYSPLPNVLVVAAHDKNGRLLPDSNFGRTVDIAAPAEYLSAYNVTEQGESQYLSSDGSYGTCSSGSFGGTSSATPLVSGAVSLIYSIYPDFSAEDVRTILLESATDYITERSSVCGSGEAAIPLEQSIPKLNVKAAVERALEILEGKISLSHHIPNPFDTGVEIAVTALDNELSVDTVTYQLSARTSENDDWQPLNSGSSDSSVIVNELDHEYAWYRLDAQVSLINTTSETELEVTKQYIFSVQSVDFVARNTVTLEPIDGAELKLERIPSVIYQNTGATNANGVKKVFLQTGDYKLYAEAADFYSTALTHVASPGYDVVFVNMTDANAVAVGSLSGSVTNNEGSPIAGASVRISGGELTNGYFASAVTDTNGQYVISNISKLASNGQTIPNFTLETSAANHLSVVREEVIVLQGKDRKENFILELYDLDGSTLYADSFEQETGWLTTGFWNRFPFSTTSVENQLQVGGYVTLAPDAIAETANLPPAFDGDYAWWYGQSDSGSFIGTQSSSDSPNSGGRSVYSNSGTLRSPIIDLTTSTMPILRFQTYWEIESVNPNESGFDWMQVDVRIVGSTSYTRLRRLNPYVDPNDINRKPKAFSSAGYYREPVWVSEEFDLSPFAGESIEIRFLFNTRDSLYNGFRGWLIDDLYIFEAQSDPVNGDAGYGIYRGKREVSEDFHRVHRTLHPASDLDDTPTPVEQRTIE